jgi:hypothetical protein
VLVLVAAARSLSLLLAFGESLLALRHEGVGGFHEIRRLASCAAHPHSMQSTGQLGSAALGL